MHHHKKLQHSCSQGCTRISSHVHPVPDSEVRLDPLLANLRWRTAPPCTRNLSELTHHVTGTMSVPAGSRAMVPAANPRFTSLPRVCLKFPYRLSSTHMPKALSLSSPLVHHHFHRSSKYALLINTIESYILFAHHSGAGSH